jgi:uncharacterized protein GlcG (DUF336 family)
MYNRKMLGLADADKIVEAIIRDSEKRNGSPLSIAVVDFRGDLVKFARMDGASFNSANMAIAKAYSSARLRHDSSTIKEWTNSLNGELDDWTDPKITTLGGAVCIYDKTEAKPTVVGAVGVGGWPTWQDDEVAARLGVAALD